MKSTCLILLIVTALVWVLFAAEQEASALADAAAATGTDDDADETADATALTTSAEGRIDPAGGVDYFRLEIPERLAVTVYATGDLDTVGRLEDQSGAERRLSDGRWIG